MAETTTAIDEILYINATDEVVKVATTNQNTAIDSHTLANLSHGFNQYLSHTFGEFTNNCSDWQWQTPRHIYFQVACALFLIAFLSPHKSLGFLLARCSLIVASILMELPHWMFAGRCHLVQPICVGQFHLSIGSNLSNEADSIWGGNRCGNFSILSIYLFWAFECQSLSVASYQMTLIDNLTHFFISFVSFHLRSDI